MGGVGLIGGNFHLAVSSGCLRMTFGLVRSSLAHGRRWSVVFVGVLKSKNFVCRLLCELPSHTRTLSRPLVISAAPCGRASFFPSPCQRYRFIAVRGP